MADSVSRAGWRSLILGLPLVLLFAFVLVSASELSVTWLVLILAGLGMVILTFLAKQPETVLFTCYIATVSIEITKGLVAEGGVYTPGLYLSLSDLFLLPLLFLRLFGHLLERRAPEKLHPVLLAAGAWLLWQWFSTLTSPVPVGALMAAINQTKYFLALWLVANCLQQPEHWRNLMRGVAMALLLHFLMSLLQVGTGGAFQLQGIKASTQQTLSYASAGLVGLFRPSGFLSHPNALADFLVLVLPALAGFLLLGRRFAGSAYLVLTTLLGSGLFLLVLTLSRGGWIAFAVGMLCFMALGFRRGIVSLVHIKRLGIVALLGVVLTVAAFPSVFLRLTESDNRSTHSRILLAEQALLIIERNPVQGVGLGAYAYSARRNPPESFSGIEPAFRKALLQGVVHNKYLLVGAETGLIGLLLFLNIFRLTFSSLWHARFPNDPQRQTLAIGMMAGLAASLATFMLEHANIGVPIETIWILLGASIALTHHSLISRPQQALGSPRGNAGGAR